MEKIFQRDWQVPFGAFSLQLDSLSIPFLLAVAILVLCAGAYGLGYMRVYRGRKPLGFHFFFYLMLALSLVFIVTANNVILFLGAWEGMTIATYFLILFSNEVASVRKAGFIYFISSHCATFFLFLMFFALAHTAGSMNFDVIARTAFSPFFAGSVFLLSLVGFGVKAGFIPLHIWLPYAHPAAPSHISALMSGVTIKMGIYGICRVIWMLGVLPDWCGYLLVVIGVVSGVMGVLYALGQHELKKLLAYHSVENIGIIALGLGVGVLGSSYHQPLIAILGFGGGILHVLNHSLFKGLLFLGAGAVIQKTHSGEMDQLGGLSRVLPVTSVLFMAGAWAICGLPLMNGFISEFIIYFGLLKGLFSLPQPGVIFCSTGILALALMGSLALACFCKVYGTVFSGTPRMDWICKDQPSFRESGLSSEQTSRWMIVPMAILAGLCLWIGLAPQVAARMAFRAASCLSYVDLAQVNLDTVFVPMAMIIGLSFLGLALFLVLMIVRRMMLGALPAPVSAPWQCAFSQPSLKFRYTASSFARSIMEFVKIPLRVRRHGGKVNGVFPVRCDMSSSVQDAAEEMMFAPLLRILTEWSNRLTNGRLRYTQMYLMYIFLFLIILLIWKLK